MYNNEIQIKLTRLSHYLAQNNLDGVLLSTRPNFAWITAGRDNHIVNASEVGVAAILATPDKLLCLTNHIESPRYRNEELAGMGIDVIDFPWWDPKQSRDTVTQIIAGRRIATDGPDFGVGLPSVPGNFTQLRYCLTDMEIQKYRYCGQIASSALEAVCRQIQPGDSEFDIVARLQFEVQRTGAFPFVTLVSTDQRVFDYRHPIPTSKKLQRYAMIVVCAEYRGLISSCTRFVHFGPLPDAIRAKQQAVCNVDATVNLATRPGRLLCEVFTDLQTAYEANGYPGEWHFHHQGGSTGYAGRDAFGTPFAQQPVLANQAFAWNPSIQGTKSEDTILVTDAGMEILTPCSDSWPKITGHAPQGELLRPDILVR